MSCTVHIAEALVAGAVGGAIVLVFAFRNNPKIVAWLGIKAA